MLGEIVHISMSLVVDRKLHTNQ